MHGASDFCITVRALDPHWRCAINAAVRSTGDPDWGRLRTPPKSSEHSHPQDFTTIYEWTFLGQSILHGLSGMCMNPRHIGCQVDFTPRVFRTLVSCFGGGAEYGERRRANLNHIKRFPKSRSRGVQKLHPGFQRCSKFSKHTEAS